MTVPPSPSAYYFISTMPNNIDRRRCIDPRQLFHHLRPPATDRATINALISSRDYKSILCRQWQRSGVCDNGGLCRDAHGQNELKCIDQPMCFEFSIYGSCSRGAMCNRPHAEPFETTFETTISQTIANLRSYSTLTDSNQWSNNVAESKTTTPIAVSDSSKRIDAIKVQQRRRKSIKTTTRYVQQITSESSVTIDNNDQLLSQHRSSRRRLQFE